MANGLVYSKDAESELLMRCFLQIEIHLVIVLLKKEIIQVSTIKGAMVYLKDKVS